MEVRELMPVSTLRAEHAKKGVTIDAPFDARDIGELTYNATVESISACPRIEKGPGRVVLMTMVHLNSDVYDLTVRDASGKTDTLGVTGGHKLYAEAAGWTSVQDMSIGEVLRGDHGDLLVWDAWGQLAAWEKKVGGSFTVTNTYTYDALGERVAGQQTGSVTSQTASLYAYSGSGQVVVEVLPHTLGASSASEHDYVYSAEVGAYVDEVAWRDDLAVATGGDDLGGGGGETESLGGGGETDGVSLGGGVTFNEPLTPRECRDAIGGKAPAAR